MDETGNSKRGVGGGVTRRQAIRLSALAGSAAALAGCLDVLSSGDSVHWRFTEMAGRSLSRPTVVDGTVYVGDALLVPETSERENAVYALDADTGEMRWTFTDTSRNAFSNSVLADGTLYVVSYSLSGTDDPVVHAVDTQTGAERWRYTGLAAFDPPLVFADGTLLVHDEGTVHGLRATEGDEDWQFGSQDGEILGVHVGGGRVFVSVADAGGATVTHALDSGAGTELWETAGDVQVYADDSLYGADPSGEIRALDAETGDRRWRSPESAWGVLVVADTTLYSVEPDNLPMQTRGTSDAPEDRATVHAMDTATGTVQWERGDVSGWMRPTVVEDTLVLSTAGQASPSLHDPEILGLDTATGERTWGWSVPGERSTTSPLVVDGRMYLGASGDLYAVETDTDGSSRDTTTLHGMYGHHGGWVYGDG